MLYTPKRLLLLAALTSALFLGFQNCGGVNVARLPSELNTCVDPSGSSPTSILDSISVDNKSILNAYVIEIRFSDRQLLSSIKEFNWLFDDKPQPPKSSIFNHDISGLVACSSHKITAQWIDSCNQPRQLVKNYIHPGDNCQEIVFSCQGSVPPDANLCPQDDKDLTKDTDRTLKDTCSAAKCEYTCATGYTNISGVCTQIPATFVCQGNIPDHSVICPDDDRNLTTNTNRTLVSSCSVPAGSVPKCEYICEVGYHNDGNACVADVFECQGAIPANSVLCPGDDVGLPSNANRTLVSACSAPLGSIPKCEYTCATGYINVAGVCTTAPPPFVLPAGFQCLDTPLHTIMASEQYARISSTSTSLLDRTEYFATRLKGNSMIWTVKIIVAAGDSTLAKALAFFEVGQGYGSGPTPRIVTLSKNKCDTSATNNIVISDAARPSNSSTFEFSLNETRSGVRGLTTGVYYLNIQNVDCGVGQGCDVLLDWHGAY